MSDNVQSGDNSPVFTPEQQAWIENLIRKIIPLPSTSVAPATSLPASSAATAISAVSSAPSTSGNLGTKRTHEQDQFDTTPSAKKPRMEASSSSKCTPTPPEERNFLKLIKIMKIIVKELRKLFEEVYRAKTLRDWENTFGKELLKKYPDLRRKLNDDQWQCIRNGNINKWDISLLCRILLFRSKSNFWRLGEVECNALRDLRDVRNRFGHSANYSLLTEQLKVDVERIVKAVETLLKGNNKRVVVSAVKEAHKSCL